jgi:trans-aconitate methyltransferase
MLDVLSVLFEDLPFRFLDLACGPGSLSRRVGDRFDAAQAVGVDLDPLLTAKPGVRRYSLTQRVPVSEMCRGINTGTQED